MSTRHADSESPPRQERFASSPEYAKGLLANLVAPRSELITEQKHRQLIWFLQRESWQPGGLEKVAAEILGQYLERIATRSMQKYGSKPGQIYNAEQVRAIRKEFPR